VSYLVGLMFIKTLECYDFFDDLMAEILYLAGMDRKKVSNLRQ
jgi:hypothetical protein